MSTVLLCWRTNVSKAAAVCLSFLAECCQDDVFTRCLPFIEANLESADWRHRDASVLAFGNILKKIWRQDPL